MLKTTEQYNVRRRRQIHAKFRVAELVDFIGQQHVERELGVARSTIDRWLKREVVPSQAMMVALESLYGKAHSMQRHKGWHDWRFGEDGLLYGPGYQYGIHGGDILGWFYERQIMSDLRRENAELQRKLAIAYEELARGDPAANQRDFKVG